MIKLELKDKPELFIREWITADVDLLPIIANNRNIWCNLRDIFPHPYTHNDAVKWVRLCKQQKEKTCFAIADGEKLIGSIGVFMQEDIFSRSCELGYWLAESYWGKGIITEAVKTFTPYIFKAFPKIVRIYAGVFDKNRGSQRVLEKAGYTFEGRMRKHINKSGKIYDELIYAKLYNE